MRDPSGGRRGLLFAAPALLWTLAFFLVPFLLMVGLSFRPPEGMAGAAPSLQNYVRFLTNETFLGALRNSIEVTAIVTVVSVILAYPLAYVIAERIPERWQRLALLAAVLPFWTSYLVRSYAWLLVLAKNGVVNNTLVGLGLVSEPMQLASTRFATVTGFVHFFVMLLTLTIYANLKQLSPNYRRAAADLGAGPLRAFVHVVLPLTLPGIMVGAFLTFVLCIGDYVTPQILGGNNELLLPQLIMLQVQRRADFPTASTLSVVLMVVVTVAYVASARWLKLERA
jgi:spermidine/putrescine transport system permease protein